MDITKKNYLQSRFCLCWLHFSQPSQRLIALIVITSIGFFWGIGLMFSYQKAQQKQLDQAALSIAQIASKQLAVPMSSNNLVGLQSLLNNLTQSDLIIKAEVFGLNHQVVVQAGTNNSSNSIVTFSQPISLDQTLMGNLRLSLNISESPLASIYLLIMPLFMVASGVLAWLSLKKTSKSIENAPNTPEYSRDSYKVPPQKREVPQIQSIAVIHLINTDELFQQLSAEVRQIKLDQLNGTLNRVLPLYSGQRLDDCKNTITIGFHGTDIQECLFQAMCCSHLLLKTAEQEKWLLKLSISLHTTSNEDLADNISTLKAIISDTGNGKLFVNSSLIQSNELNSRVLVTTVNSKVVLINGFRSDYEKLLNSQLSLLRTQ